MSQQKKNVGWLQYMLSYHPPPLPAPASAIHPALPELRGPSVLPTTLNRTLRGLVALDGYPAFAMYQGLAVTRGLVPLTAPVLLRSRKTMSSIQHKRTRIIHRRHRSLLRSLAPRTPTPFLLLHPPAWIRLRNSPLSRRRHGLSTPHRTHISHTPPQHRRRTTPHPLYRPSGVPITRPSSGGNCRHRRCRLTGADGSIGSRFRGFEGHGVALRRVRDAFQRFPEVGGGELVFFDFAVEVGDGAAVGAEEGRVVFLN